MERWISIARKVFIKEDTNAIYLCTIQNQFLIQKRCVHFDKHTRNSRDHKILFNFFPIRRLPVERCLYLSTNLNLGTFCWSEVTINLHFCLLIEESPSSNSCEKLVQTSSKCDPLSQLLDQFLSKTFYVGITGISNKYFHIWISQKQNNLTDGPHI